MSLVFYETLLIVIHRNARKLQPASADLQLIAIEMNKIFVCIPVKLFPLLSNPFSAGIATQKTPIYSVLSQLMPEHQRHPERIKDRAERFSPHRSLALQLS